MPGPLSGIRVLDLTAMISGPVAAQLLADQGAEVIKVEPPAGDIVRGMGVGNGLTGTFLSSNRSKKSLVLDLKTERGVELLKSLAETADVFMQNFRPGAVERMGIGYDVISAVNPGIVYVSISGFGESGPYAHKRVYDPVIQALSGLASIQQNRETGRPNMIRTIIPDKLTAMTGAQAITAALFERERNPDKAGQHVRLAMLDAMVAFLWPEGLVSLTFPGGENQVGRSQLAQDLIFETQDGYITCGAVSDAEWSGMCAALDKPEWLDDERFNSPTKRVTNAPARLEQTQEVLRTNTSAYWLARLDAHDVPSAPVLSRADLLQHPQILANDLIGEHEVAGVGTIRQPRPAARFERTPAAMQAPAPRLGADSRSVLAEVGVTDTDFDALLAEGVTRETPAGG